MWAIRSVCEPRDDRAVLDAKDFLIAFPAGERLAVEERRKVGLLGKADRSHHESQNGGVEASRFS